MKNILSLRRFSSFCVLTLLMPAACNKEGDGDDTPADSQATLELTLSSDTFTAHEGQTIHLAVMDPDQRKRRARKTATVTDGAFSMSAPEAVRAQSLTYVDFYVDTNDNDQCDAPPADHGWRIKIQSEDENINLEAEHHFGFTNVCDSFSAKPYIDTEDTRNIVITGKLTLSTEVTPEDATAADLSIGDPVEGATVFIAGIPEQEATTNSQGAFTLNIHLDDELQRRITDNPDVTLTMWYAKPQDDSNAGEWAISEAKFGATKSISLSTDNIEVDSTSLAYTKGLRLTVLDADNSSTIDTCWIHLPDFGFQLQFQNEGEGAYRVDYLPPGTYEIDVNCPGYEAYSFDYDIPEAVTAGTWEVIETVAVMPEEV